MKHRDGRPEKQYAHLRLSEINWTIYILTTSRCDLNFERRSGNRPLVAWLFFVIIFSSLVRYFRPSTRQQQWTPSEIESLVEHTAKRLQTTARSGVVHLPAERVAERTEHDPRRRLPAYVAWTVLLTHLRHIRTNQWRRQHGALQGTCPLNF